MCKKCTSSWGGVRKLPYAFTEQGIYMLMTVLKGDLAVRQSMALIRLFKQMKDYIVAENKQLLGNDGIAQIALQTSQNTRDIAEHSADIAYMKIYGMAKKNIIIIDNFSLRSIF